MRRPETEEVRGGIKTRINNGHYNFSPVKLDPGSVEPKQNAH